MDMIAPNPDILSTGFIQLGIILILSFVATLKLSSATHGIQLWAKMNAPIVSIILCEVWAVMSYLAFRPAPNLDDYFVVGIWMAGGASIVSSTFKDVRDGSYKVTDELDVIDMRRKNPRRGGVGA